MQVRLPYIPYYERTPFDDAYYREFIEGRLPDEIFDVHVHLNLPEHVRQVPRERILSDWALECAYLLTCDDAYRLVQELFPGRRYGIAGFPWPIREADLEANNAYLAEMKKAGRLEPFMVVRPEWDKEEVEQALLQGAYVGFKPYPDMVSGKKGAEIGIFEFMPPALWRIADKHKKAVMLHLPRKERFADEDNIRELHQARQEFPDTRIIVAHLGRSFCPYYLREGLRKIGDVQGFRFDLSGVMNPEVLDIAFTRIPSQNILYGSDMPIFLWHGTREWTERTYTNLAREDFSWSGNHRPPEEESRYTLFLYQQLRNILDAMDRHGIGGRDRQGVFAGNALKTLGL
jgi:predicted TIM-barrel fold metal-dependent hydrolase